MTDAADRRFMDSALALARSQLGRTAPNPAVGCLIVKNGAVAGRGATGDGGRPHAERIALDQAGETARGATVYVSLEPCAHHGVTPPCAQALIDAGVARVVFACPDPDPRVNGGGAAMLNRAGIVVQQGLREAEAKTLNAGFFRRLSDGRPLISIDLLDGGYDSTLSGEAFEDLDKLLKFLTNSHLTRIRIMPGTRLASRVNEAGLCEPRINTRR